MGGQCAAGIHSQQIYFYPHCDAVCAVSFYRGAQMLDRLAVTQKRCVDPKSDKTKVKEGAQGAFFCAQCGKIAEVSKNTRVSDRIYMKLYLILHLFFKSILL